MANTYKALSTVSVGAGGAANIDFTNIPQTYTDIVIKVSSRVSSTDTPISVRFNGATDASWRRIYGNGASATSQSGTDTFWFYTNTSAQTANTFGSGEIYIPNYVGSSNKSVSSESLTENNGTTAEMFMVSALWANTAPITRITLVPLTGNFVQHSTATLYGVFNADVSTAPATPTIGTASAGGNQASITFTPVSNAASYTMTSTPGSISATGTASPITVTGLTAGTSYSFKVRSNNPFGSSNESAASNSVTPFVPSAYESIATTILGADTNSITISSIPQTYQHLVIRLVTTTSVNSPESNYYTRFNGDNGANYTNNNMIGDGGSQAALYNVNNTELLWGYTYGAWAYSPTATIVSEQIIPNYSSSTQRKTWLIQWGVNGPSAGGASIIGASWNSSAAINSVTILSTGKVMTANTSIAIYGIKGS